MKDHKGKYKCNLRINLKHRVNMEEIVFQK